MKNSIRRLIAGVSAAALLMSAVGFDAFMNMVTRDVAAVETGKNGRSTGFSKLEQDTDKDIYNTGYGLHTNKTATEVNDGTGRTFDVNLESWYVGENPVDVATILDASGSMAWTVDTLDPLEITNEMIENINKKYNFKSDSPTIKDLRDWQNNAENDGYLPQDAVDMILDPAKTDNSKLSYADYMYYVYEERSSVSEFVPLGYWDGGIDPKNDSSLIGYYPFSGDLKNKAPNATDGASGMLINHPTGSESTYNTSEKASETLKAEFVTKEVDVLNSKGKPTGNKETVVKGLNIADSSLKGAILVASPSTDKFSISFEMSVDNSDDGFDQATILYLTDGTSDYRIYRDGSSSASRLKATVNGSNILNAKEAVNTKPRQWTFTFDFTEGSQKLHIKTDTENVLLDNKNKLKEYTIDLSSIPGLEVSNLKIYIGGNITEYKNPNDIYIKNLSIKDIADDGTETEVANYPLDTEANGLTNNAGSKEKAIFVAQPYNNGGNFGETEIGTHLLDPVFDESNKYLNVKATSQNGAVMIDAVPELDADGFTISMKLQRTDSLDKKENNQQNILYYGDKNKESKEYYQYFRSALAGGFLGITKGVQQDFTGTPTGADMVYYKGGIANSDWYTNTLVFKPDPDNVDRIIVTPYINGKPDYQDTTNINTSIDSISVNKSDLVLLLCALKKNGSGSNQYLDDLYIFDKALDAEVVNAYFGDNTVFCEVGDDTTHALSYIKDAAGNYVSDEDGNLKTIEIAQISNGDKRLGQNTDINKRRGWYYVNSASAWADIEGCLASGKQYIGIFTDDGIATYSDMTKDVATVPSALKDDEKFTQSLSDGDNDHDAYEAPEKERSIRFYVDEAKHLRCFVWSGDTTKSEDNKRTFCSLVYEKKFINETKSYQNTKYEELNNALNTFYQNLAKNSDLSNTSVVRFSTNNAVDKEKTDTTNTNLKKLIMKDWTNWSDYYLADMEENKDVENYKPNTENYLLDLLIPKDGEKATDTDKSSTRDDIDEYPYVMTGGTYTWTGLKAFYDNMVKKDGLGSGDRVYDVANDARDKYLIIFTDGRDNTQDYDVITNVSDELDTALTGSPNYTTGNAFGKTDFVKTYNPYKDDPKHLVGFSIENYTNQDYARKDEYSDYPELVQQFKTGVHEIKTDGDLAQAWADKIKEEGYTIYCVMLATGSISESTNKDEYNKAYNFLRSLAGGDDETKELEDLIDYHMNNGTKPDEIARYQEQLEELKKDHVIVVDPSKDGGMTVTDAFQKILNDIQQPRNDYTVQDYIDPRFNLIGKGYKIIKDSYVPIEVIYHLGANGTVTFTDTNNQPIESDDDYVYFDNGSYKTGYRKKGETAGNIIDKSDAYGLAYTPKSSYMVNRRETTDTSSKDGYDTGDGTGTGYLYYDDFKDMYYLRWEDQVIPMENETFDTTDGGKKLDVWSATIRLKAKDDFIGGNNILTNGNEAGENLVYSDATIENMDKNPDLYFTDGEEDHTLREKLQVLSGTDRKINAVDAGGVSQAVYGDGIDIPSSGFPRVTVNVRLKPLDAKNLNDVIYMGEVLSPTMMLADLENGYMEGSYYLEYLERYAYRVYGYDADKMPLIELLNQWLKINDKDETEKTFTIPYIYLPNPVYSENGKLVKDSIQNSTGWDSTLKGKTDFTDPNLRDVTGFITYTWKRDDKGEEQQKVEDPTDPSKTKQDITKEYVIKNTNQIKYNLRLTFTPLKEGNLEGFEIDKNFIKADAEGTGAEKFFNIKENEFNDKDVVEWTFTKRTEYLQAMVKEQHTYTPHVAYNETSKKWELKEGTAVTDKDTYDWDKEYKKVVGNAQIEGENLTKYYTQTPENVGFADKYGNQITNQAGAFTGTYSTNDVCSLVANTTYVKDVVNGALALELIVDGTYLKQAPSDSPIESGKEYKIIATRYYDDPIDPLPYGENKKMYADTGDTEPKTDKVNGKKYQLTFRITDLPKNPQANTLYQVWAELENVEVDSGSDTYKSIIDDGFFAKDALPIGTYVIDTTDNPLSDTKFQMGKNEHDAAEYFKYLKIDNAPESYTYDKFPESVYNASQTAPDSTGVDEYLIKNGGTDYSQKNIAVSNRNKDSDNQILTFYFGTVKDKEVGTGTLHNTKGDSHLVDEENDYAKDRLGIILLSADPNSLAISKTVTNTDKKEDLDRSWEFTITFEPDSAEDNMADFEEKNNKETGSGFGLKWYTLKGDKWELDETSGRKSTIKFEPESEAIIYKATISLKHNEKVVITGLPEGTWQVTEKDERGEVFYSAHNNMDEKEDHEFSNETKDNIQLNPASHVDFVNEFPHALPSAGGTGRTGINIIIYCGIMFVVAAGLYFAIFYRKKRKISDEQQR